MHPFSLKKAASSQAFNRRSTRSASASFAAALAISAALLPLTPRQVQAADQDPSKQEAAKTLPELKIDSSPLPAGTPTYAPIIEKVAPSVVTINTSQTARRGMDSDSPLSGNPLLNDPMLRRFFGIPDPEEGPQRPSPRQSKPSQRNQAPQEAPGLKGRKREQSTPLGLGSGVIVSPDGYILTNNHVIEGADKIEVSLGKNGKSYTARKVGGDQRTDIAVLKIDAKNLQPITFSDSDLIRSGDVVIAVGSPFGLSSSATMGVVSAVGRNTQMSQLADLGNFIQTDAAINMGNSGGALVDYQGRLVGINTAIFSRSGGNQGIGFSVPANMARSVMESLIKHGRVLRGYLGVGLQEVSEAFQKEYGIEAGQGALINEVQAGTPAQKAGILVEDVIVAVNGRKVEGVQDLRISVASMQPGVKVTLKVIRQRKPLEISVQLGEKSERNEVAKVVEEADPDVLDGVGVADLDDANRKEFKIPADIKGAVVTSVDPDCIAAEAGVRPGDVIQEVKRRPVSSADEAVRLSEEFKKEKQLLIRIYSRGNSRLMMLESKP